MIVAGIDPGKNGALVLVSGGEHQPFGIYADMVGRVPILNTKTNGKIKSKPNYAAMADQWLGILQFSDHVFIEKVGAMPGQGVSSMFSFGYVAGFMLALVLASKNPYTFVTPQSWKKVVGISGSEGDVSRQRASQLFPAFTGHWPFKKDDGVAEAALIGYSGHTILKGKS